MLAMTLFVRDEEDILATTVQHHLDQGIDHVYVCDNGSTDRTRSVLEPFRRAGVVTVECDPEHRMQQGEAITRLAQRACEDGASWVIHDDADEFWFASEGSVRDALGSVPSEVGVVVARRYNFVHRERVGVPWHRAMDVRLRFDQHLPGFGEGRLAPKVAHRARPGVRVHQGAHAVDHPQLDASLDDGRLEILHVPLRDPARFTERVARHGEAYEASGLPETVGHVRRSLYRSLLEGTLAERLSAASFDDARVEAGLLDGSLVRDVRLAEVFTSAERRLPEWQSAARRRSWFTALARRLSGGGRDPGGVDGSSPP
jgi:hypothetical protein